MTTPLSFQAYTHADKAACLRIFDANCPVFFMASERGEYEHFLDEEASPYELCLLDGRVIGAFGLIHARLNWIVLAPQYQGRGLGARLMQLVSAQAQALGLTSIGLETTHKVAPFYSKLGAITDKYTPNGWSEGVHHVEMTLPIPMPMRLADSTVSK